MLKQNNVFDAKIGELGADEVKYDDQGRIVSLNLCNKHLTSLPASISKHLHIENLEVSHNEIADFPNVISRLPRLKILSLTDNLLSELPTEIGKLNQLQTLDISRNQLLLLSTSITNLSDLENLVLTRNRLTVIPREIGQLVSLKTLSLSGNHLRILPENIGQLSKLTELNIRNNRLIELTPTVGELKSLNVLRLSNNRIKGLPSSISQLSDLNILSLGHNNFSEFPKEVTSLKQLKNLNLSNNGLKSLPSEIGNLFYLQYLDLYVNLLSYLPAEINCLRQLIRLDLFFNKLTKLPQEIGQLVNLRYLSLGRNKLEELPEQIGNLNNLVHLDVSFNRLEGLPRTIGHLSKLRTLSLEGNRLSDIPSELGDLTQLTKLELGKNRITRLPPQLGRLDNLEILDVSGNPLELPPPEIVANGTRAILDYLKQLEKEGIDYLYEAKLLIVGEGGAGKTTLAKKLQNHDYKLRDESSTEGIDVIQWKFPLNGDKQFRVNIWDFGGQEIYHATHQFFLTKRSLYALVADTRREDTDFFYWLNVVRLLSNNSPLLIIKNEKQDRHREINERMLRGQFTNLKETLPTNLAHSRKDFHSVVTAIKHYIQNLPHVGTALPKTWVKVRAELESDPRNYISLEEYLHICEQNGFNNRTYQLQLSSYLHDLGVCLHFQDDPLLRNLLILKPEWGTYAVYKVLDNKKVIRNLGNFSSADLKDIWQDNQYENVYNELLQLMIKFKLCYQVPGTDDTYIAPQLLTENQPNYEWPSKNNLTFRYTYEFLPKGIITQFIVNMHTLIAKQKYVWKSGVVLKNAETAAEVIQNYGKREIRIRIFGKHKKELLTIITYEFDRIHATYDRLKVNKLIPCNCNSCKDDQEPHYYLFDVLRDFISNRQQVIQCQRQPYHMVNVLGLIDDVIGEKEFIRQETERRRDLVFQSPIRQVIIQQSNEGRNIMNMINQEKVIKIGDNTQISAPLIIADNIEKSFNMITEAEVHDDIKILLDQLLKTINQVGKIVPPEKAEVVEMMSRDAMTLVGEATSSNPRSKWYEISVEGLKQAAINIGDIAKPVLEIVEKILPLLPT